MRAFFALELAPPAQQAAAALLHALRTQPGAESCRWVRPEGLHMTLRFLGEIAPARRPALVRCVTTQLAVLPPFELRLGSVQLFPSPSRPRVVALHLDPVPPVERLAHALERGVVAAGFEPERRSFHGHVTLARLRDTHRCLDLACVEPPPPSPFEVSEIVLFESQLAAGGSRYFPRERLALAGCVGAERDADAFGSPLTRVLEESKYG